MNVIVKFNFFIKKKKNYSLTLEHTSKALIKHHKMHCYCKVRKTNFTKLTKIRKISGNIPFVTRILCSIKIFVNKKLQNVFI